MARKTSGQLPNEVRLLLERKLQVAVALVLGGERGENFALDAEVWRAHVRAFLSAFEAQGDSAEIGHTRH